MDRMNHCGWGALSCQQPTGNIQPFDRAWHRNNPAATASGRLLSGLPTNVSRCGRRQGESAQPPPCFRRFQGLDADGLVSLSLGLRSSRTGSLSGFTCPKPHAQAPARPCAQPSPKHRRECIQNGRFVLFDGRASEENEIASPARACRRDWQWFPPRLRVSATDAVGDWGWRSVRSQLVGLSISARAVAALRQGPS